MRTTRAIRSSVLLNATIFPAMALLGLWLLARPAARAATNSPPWVDVYVVLEGAPGAQAAEGARSADAIARSAPKIKARLDSLAAQHAAMQPRIESLGGTVRTHYTKLVNAMKVRIAPEKLSALSALPGVKKVTRVRTYNRALTVSVPLIGGPAAWSSFSPAADGAGIRIGIIDTGIDYTHADFGGPGTVDAYNNIDTTRITPGTFPTAKVVGGYDLAGDNYDASSPDTSIPAPDPNPLDCDGHGSHVAGIASGFGVLTNGQTYSGPYSSSLDYKQFGIGPGVAPHASLYAIKIFGCTGSTDLVPDALEWAADPTGNGTFSNRMDVVNMSLGSSFGSVDPEDPEIMAVNNLVALGCAVCCAAGNDGDIVYISSTPGSSPSAITVANTTDQGNLPAIQIQSPASIAGAYEAVEGDFTAPIAQVGPISGKVVYVEPHDACSPLTNTNQIAGNIALIDRGTCFFTDKIQLAQNAGAIAVIMVDNRPETPIVMGASGTPPNITIPGVMISQTDGATIKSQLTNGVTVTALFSSTVTIPAPQDVDNIAPSSSRGPVMHSHYLKPEISAPGTGIYSVAMGTGTSGVSFTGTSMATPHITGSVALLRQVHPTWSPEDIKAALMNTSVSAHDTSYNQYPESMQGAGRVQVNQAVVTEVTATAANSDGNVALSFGSLVLASAWQTNGVITVTNHGTNAASFAVAISNTMAQAGFTVTPAVTNITVPAQSSLNVSIGFSADPTAFTYTPDPTTPAAVDGYTQSLLNEASGQIWFIGGNSLHVPYYASIRAASDDHVQSKLIVLPATESTNKVVPINLTISNGGSNPNALLSTFELGFVTPSAQAQDVLDAEADVVAAGAASDVAQVGSVTNANLYFGLATATSWATPNPGILQLQVAIDTNGDDIVDFVLVNGTYNDVSGDTAAQDVLFTVVQSLDQFGNIVNEDIGNYLNYYAPDQVDSAPFDNSVMVLSVPAAQLGLADNFSVFRYKVDAYDIYNSSNNIVSSGWVTFDAAHPIFDTTVTSPDGTIFNNDGAPIQVKLDRQAAGNMKQRLPGILLLHHHNLEGSRAEIVHIDLSNDDTDNDGLPDWWEMQYFHNLTTANGTTDTDHDGFKDYFEYLAGTDPTDPKSYLKVTSAVLVPGQGIMVTWPSVPFKNYYLLNSSDLTAGIQNLLSTSPATPPFNQYLDTNTTATQGYYQIQLAP